MFAIPASLGESEDRRIAGLFFSVSPCGISYVHFTSLRQFREAKRSIFNLQVLKTWGIGEFLCLSVCPCLCSESSPGTCTCKCCAGGLASGSSSLVAAVRVQDEEVAGVASRRNCKWKAFQLFFPYRMISAGV